MVPILISITLVGLFFLVVNINKRKAKLAHSSITQESNLFLDRLKRFDDELRPFLLFEKGETGEEIKRLSAVAAELFEGYSEVEHELLQVQIRAFGNKALEETFSAQRERILTLESALDDLFQSIRKIKLLDVQLKRAVKEKKADVEQLSEHVKEVAARIKYPLHSFQKEVHQLYAFLGQATLSSDIDPLRFQEEMELEFKKIPEIEKSLELIEKVADEFQFIDSKIQYVTAKVDEILAEENLISVTEKKHACLQQIDDMKYRLAYYLENGNTAKSLATLKAIFNTLEEMMKSSQDISHLKAENDVTLQYIEDELSLFTEQLDEIFAEEISKLKSCFAETYWNTLNDSFATMKLQRSELVSSLPAIKKLNDPSVQDYEQAKEKLATASSLLKEIKSIKDDCFTLYDSLLRQYEKATGLYRESLQRFEDLKKSLEVSALPKSPLIDKKMTLVENETGQINQLFAAEKKDVDRLTNSIIQLNRYLYEFQTQVEEAIRYRKEAESQFTDLKLQFSKRYNQYRRKVDVKDLAKQYQLLIMDAQEKLENGLYSKSLALLNQVKEIVVEMDERFDSLEAEKEAEEEKKTAEIENFDAVLHYVATLADQAEELQEPKESSATVVEPTEEPAVEHPERSPLA